MADLADLDSRRSEFADREGNIIEEPLEIYRWNEYLTAESKIRIEKRSLTGFSISIAIGPGFVIRIF